VRSLLDLLERVDGFIHDHAAADLVAAAVGESVLDLDKVAAEVIEMCKARGWSLHWTARGAYLHLEASELIEAVRGKHGSVLEEAGDVLLVLMSITENSGIKWSDVVAQTVHKLEGLKTKPHYQGEEYVAAVVERCEENT
jgi:NTP pyrophosphatase (non-canonical NTP hydrolase)